MIFNGNFKNANGSSFFEFTTRFYAKTCLSSTIDFKCFDISKAHGSFFCRSISTDLKTHIDTKKYFKENNILKFNA